MFAKCILPACAALVLAAGCTGVDASGGDLPFDDALAVPDAATVDVPAADKAETVPAHAPCRLEFADATDDSGASTAGATVFQIGIGCVPQRPLKVRCTGDAGPLTGVDVAFAPEADAAGIVELSAPLATTDETGLAMVTMTLVAGAPDPVHVRACVADDPAATCLRFAVVQTSMVPLIAVFSRYDGVHADRITHAEVRLFKQDMEVAPDCDALSPDALPAATVVSPPLNSLTSTALFPDLPGLDKDKVQSYAVVGLARDDAGNLLAWGCTAVAVEYGNLAIAEIPLADLPAPLPPRLAATYAVETRIDLATGEGSPGADIVQRVAALLADPIAGTLALACLASGPGDDLATFCLDLFTDPAGPDAAHATPLGQALAAALGPAPFAWTAAEPVRTALSDIRLRSTLSFACPGGAPAVTAPGCATQTWTAILLRWTGEPGCSADDFYCGFEPFEPGQLPGMTAPLVSLPPVTVADAALSIAAHDVDLDPAVLIESAMHLVVLPRALGDGTDGLPPVGSFEDVIAAVLGGGRACLADDSCCATFGATAATLAYESLDATRAVALCDGLVAAGPRYLLARTVAVDNFPENLRLATAAACPLADSGADGVWNAFGTQDAPCPLDAMGWYGAAEFPVPATFHGCQQQGLE